MWQEPDADNMNQQKLSFNVRGSWLKAFVWLGILLLAFCLLQTLHPLTTAVQIGAGKCQFSLFKLVDGGGAMLASWCSCLVSCAASTLGRSTIPCDEPGGIAGRRSFVMRPIAGSFWRR
jgi:hypothetical protein